jgi:hypothetical protein
MSQRVTQAILQVLSPLAVPNVRVTEVHAIVLGYNPAPKRGCEPNLWDQAASEALGRLRLAGASGLAASAAQ